MRACSCRFITASLWARVSLALGEKLVLKLFQLEPLWVTAMEQPCGDDIQPKFTSVSLRVSSVSPALPMLELSSQPVALKYWQALRLQTSVCS